MITDLLGALPDFSRIFTSMDSIVIALILLLVTILLFLHLTWLQLVETATFWGDYLNRYRIRILVCLVIVDATLLPVAWYLVLFSLGIENQALKEFSRIAGRIGPLALAIAFESVFFYNRRKK